MTGVVRRQDDHWLTKICEIPVLRIEKFFGFNQFQVTDTRFNYIALEADGRRLSA